MEWGSSYLIERVASGEYGRIDIFAGYIDDHKGHHPFLTLREKENDGAAMLERVKKFVQDSGGQYTVYLRPYHNAPWPQAEKLFVNVVKQLQPVNGAPPSQMDVENLVNQRIAERMAAMERAKELADIKAENERLKQPVERLALLAEMVLNKYVPMERQSAPTIQGTPTSVDPAEFQTAVNGLVQKFTAAGLIKLNKQLDDQPHMIQLVKDYVRI